MSLAVVKSRQVPWHRSIVAGAVKPTGGVPYGATLFEYVDGSTPPIGSWWVFTEAGWVQESVPGLTPVYIHTITPTVVDAGAAQTDVVTIDGVACSFTSDATPTAAEIVTGLKAAIAASTAAGKFVVSGTATLILTPAGAVNPVVAVSANLADVQTLGSPVMGALAAGDNNIGNVDIVTLPAANLYPVTIHTITPTIVNAAAIQTDHVVIDGYICTFTSDATPTATEIVTGLKAAIAASPAVGRFTVTGTATLILTPAYGYDPSVEVSTNLTDVRTAGAIVMVGTRMSSSDAHIGEVGCSTLPITVTPAIGAAAFHANDIVGGKLVLPKAARVPGGTGIWTTLTVVDDATQAAELEIYVFNADLTVAADNAAEATTAADWLKFVGMAEVLAADYHSLALGSVANVIVNIPYKVAGTGTSLYAFIRCPGTPTYTANSLQLTFGMLRD